MTNETKTPSTFARDWNITGSSIQTGDVHGDDLTVAASSKKVASPSAPIYGPRPSQGGTF